MISDYHIPAGNIVLTDIEAVHNDPAHWCKQFLYDLTRFLNFDGTEMEQMAQAFVAFIFGKPVMIFFGNNKGSSGRKQ